MGLYRISQLQAAASRLKLMHEATAQNDDLCSLKHTVQAGWPSQIQEVPFEIQPYWNFHEEITIGHGLLLKGTRTTLPRGQRQELLKQSHTCHLGLSECI